MIKIKHKSASALSTASSGDPLLVLLFLDPRRSEASTELTPFAPGKRPRACHPPTQSWQHRRKTGKLSSFRHGQDARPHVLQDEILIIFLAADGLAPSTPVAYEVTTLARTSQKNSLRAGVFTAKLFLTRAQSVKGSAVFGPWSARSSAGSPASPGSQWG